MKDKVGENMEEIKIVGKLKLINGEEGRICVERNGIKSKEGIERKRRKDILIES